MNNGCVSCKYFPLYQYFPSVHLYNPLYNRYNCSYPENVITTSKTNWLSIKTKHKYKRKPWRINKNNDCSWFSSK